MRVRQMVSAIKYPLFAVALLIATVVSPSYSAMSECSTLRACCERHKLFDRCRAAHGPRAHQLLECWIRLASFGLRAQ